MARAALIVTVGLSLGLSFTGCITKDPLRAPWLYSGLYANVNTISVQAPPAPWTSSSPSPGRPVASQGEGTVAPVDVDARVDIPGLGSWRARVFLPGVTVPGRTYVAPEARPIRLLDPGPQGSAPEWPGFFYGLDLRPYRSIAFVVDTASWLCSSPAGVTASREEIPPDLASVSNALDRAVAGLRPDQTFVVFQGAAERLERYAPHTPEGRAMAARWLRGTVCGGITAPAPLLREAFAGAPDVVVMLARGDEPTPVEREWYLTHTPGGCAGGADPMFCTDPAQSAATDPNRRPVLAVAFDVPDSPWMRRLADATRGAFVHATR